MQLEISRGREQARAATFSPDRPLHFGEPVIESSFRYAHKRDRAPVFHSLKKVNLE